MTTPGKATRDLSGPTGLTTPQFVAAVRHRLDLYLAGKSDADIAPPSTPAPIVDAFPVDVKLMKELFDKLDTDKNGTIDFDEFSAGLKKLGVTPRKLD